MNYADQVTVEDVTMKRDMELVRTILFRIEDKKDLVPQRIVIEWDDQTQVGRHFDMLFKQGLIDGMPRKNMQVDSGYDEILVRDLSWEGHDFLANIRKEEVWSKMKDMLGPDGLSSFSWDVLKDIAKTAASEWAKKKLGLSDAT